MDNGKQMKCFRFYFNKNVITKVGDKTWGTSSFVTDKQKKEKLKCLIF